MPDEIMTPIKTQEAMKMAEVHALRALADAISAQGREHNAQGERIAAHMEASNRAMEKFGLRIENMNERLIRLEEQKHGREIDNLRAEVAKITAARDTEVGGLKDKIDKLEARDDQRSGVRQFLEMVPKFAPWIISIIAAIAAWQSVKAN